MIQFNHDTGEVYLEVPANTYLKQEAARDYYFRPRDESKASLQEAQVIVSAMSLMYRLGKEHRSLEIRKALEA
jgi:hypothetical protein